MIRAIHPQTFGISAIASYEPPWTLGNDWFSEILSRKFVHHTGILSRRISTEDEVAIGIRAVQSLLRESTCDLRDCAAVVFVSPSIVVGHVAREHLDGQRDWLTSTNRAAREFVRRLDIPAAQVYGINWGCSGYSKALSIVQRQILPSLRLRQDQFVMVATASRISRITDYGCKQTAPLFGDLATATILFSCRQRKIPRTLRARPCRGGDADGRKGVLRLPCPGERAVAHAGGRKRLCLAATGVFARRNGDCRCRTPRHGRRHRQGALQGTRHPARKRCSFSCPIRQGTGIVRFTENETGGTGHPRGSHQWPDERRRQRQFLLRSLCLAEDLEPAARHHRLPNRGSRAPRRRPSVAWLRHSPGHGRASLTAA